jgi:hypothetical protein
MLNYLLAAHEIIISKTRQAIDQTTLSGDRSNDLLMSDVLPSSESQVWFSSEHLGTLSAKSAARHY